MHLSAIATIALSLIACTDAYKYKLQVNDTTDYSPFPLIIGAKSVNSAGHTLQLRKDNSDFNVVFDKTSPVLFAQLEDGVFRANIRDLKAKSYLKYLGHAGLRSPISYDKGKTNLSDVYITTKTARGQDGFKFFIGNHRGTYYLTHKFGPIAKGFNSESTYFLLCSRDDGEYEQLVYAETGGRKLGPKDYPKNCYQVGGSTTLAPKGGIAN